MRPRSIETTELRELFRKNIVMTLDDLIKQTKVSRITIMRRLKEMGHITSYNRNGTYYALPEIAEFDESELWNYKGIRFSKNGGLQEVIIGQINSSENGYTSEELSTKLGTRVSNHLRNLTRKGLIFRKKYSYFYIYYSVNETNQKKQIAI